MPPRSTGCWRRWRRRCADGSATSSWRRTEVARIRGAARAARARGGTLAVAESFTGGSIAARLLQLDGAEALFRRGVVSRDPTQLAASVGLPPAPASAPQVALALRAASGASHALAVLVTMEGEGAEAGGSIAIGLADPTGSLLREARLVGGREWVRLGAAEARARLPAPAPRRPAGGRKAGFRAALSRGFASAARRHRLSPGSGRQHPQVEETQA
ncbi:CinA family protein [Dankookia sp. P2]|uniref:CinA family protein n=1 Tax=Dankookia sp. P2 TaxID=3423955 RepID=UPI003D668363